MDDEFLRYVYKKKEGIERNLDNINTLVLRGSHADYGVYTNGETGIYNLGLTSSDLYLSYKLYDKYSQVIDNLDNVIVVLGVPAAGLSLVRTKEKYRLVAYKYFFDIPYQIEDQIDKKLERKIIAKCQKLKNPHLSTGYFGYEAERDFITEISPEIRAKTHLRENQRHPNQLGWLQDLINQVRKDKKNLFIVIPPVKESYADCLPDKSILFRSLFLLDLKNVEVIDFYGSPLFQDKHFGDPDHLNEIGAKRLSNELLSRLRPLR
jgi:hypothetical protein|tara:strand:- start:19 stop:810 length:792 start_codon:yes stop_codon:yes gene_type:complete